MSAPCLLIVDDNPTNLKLISDVLEYGGYEVLQAIDAEQAQRILAQRLPDLLLLDIALPGMDGLALTRKLRSEARTRALPIVAITAFAMKGDEEKARAAGCDGYITKPINTRTLPRQISSYLPGKETAAPAASLKILVVEDTLTELKLAKLVLESNGHQVSGVTAAEKALLAIKRDRPQIILLDMGLPGMNGLELARLLKADPETRSITIVAVTAFPERFPKAESLAAGCDAYLTKPIDATELVKRVAQAGQGAPI